MSTATATLDGSTFLRRVLLADAATCAATGLFLTLLARPLAPLFGLPAELHLYAGASLFPVAAFIAWVASRAYLSRRAVSLVILGNILWVAASLVLLAPGWVSPTALGYIFVVAQAAAVGLLAELEWVGLGRMG
jgi:hypothetical protein